MLANKNGVQTLQSIALTVGPGKPLGKRSLLANLVSMTVRMTAVPRGLKTAA